MSAPPKDHKVQRPLGPWVPSNETDITKAWERAREEIERQRKEREEKVRDIKQIGVRK